MTRLRNRENIYVDFSKLKNAGRGVFAATQIKKGETIETCPVLEIPTEDTALLSESILVSYFYFVGEKKDKVFLVLGYGSIYNHSKDSNARFIPNIKTHTMKFVATKDIKKDAEILVDYNPEGNEKLWFEK